MNTDYNINHSLEYIYDVYSPIIYGIAVQISSDELEAENILTATFKKISKLTLAKQGSSSLCIRLIKLTIETACDQFPKYKNGKLELKQFQKLPIFYQLVCENISIESVCTQYDLTTPQLMKYLREELAWLSNVKKRFLVRAITIPA
jgi:hypothetical protein